MAFDRLAIHLVDLKERFDVIKYVSGEAYTGLQPGNRQPLYKTEARHVMLAGQTLVRNNTVIDTRFCRDKSYLGLGMCAGIIVGLRNQLDFVGTINLFSRNSGSHWGREKAILERLAVRIAPAIASSSLYKTTLQVQKQVNSSLDQLKADRNELEARLSKALDDLSRLSHALNVCPSAVMIADHAATIRYVNRQFTQLTAYEDFEVLGKPVTKLASGYSEEEGSRRLGEVMTSGAPWAGERRAEESAASGSAARTEVLQPVRYSRMPIRPGSTKRSVVSSRERMD